jgi:hypothetical protein
MWFGSTKNLLDSLVRSLKSEDGQDEAAWQAQTELAQACLSEMIELSQPVHGAANGATSRYVHRPVQEKLNRARPHVEAMVAAMRNRDRAKALTHGETALQRL